MALKLMIGMKYVLEGMFFVGLLGCTTTVIFSWIMVFRDALVKDDEDR